MGKFKFDVAIGNPPYQDEAVGDNKTFAPPIYNVFMDETFKVCNKVELIHPARFLFNAGSTPKQWNKKMLNNKHFKVIHYEGDASKVFSNTEIKGGVAITYFDADKDFGTIDTFTPYDELHSIMKKVVTRSDFKPFSSIVFPRSVCRLTEKLHEDFPTAESRISKGHKFDVSSNIFDILDDVFLDSIPQDGHEYLKILGRSENQRVYKYIRNDYIRNTENLDKYKVFLPNVGGTGRLGEVLSTPEIGAPNEISTETFISIGAFVSEEEAKSVVKYVKGKFARALLGILKVTHHKAPAVWEKVPLQNFSVSSDIDWTQPIASIDRQLYRKYGLDENEISFIEKNVKEMD